MAIIYSEKHDGVRYEIRSAGATKRLYTNGAFHTQYHPKYLFTGAVWDLLCLPTLCLNADPKRVLVLGVAGGTVIHQIQRLCKAPHITGIELDKVHIKLARLHFELNYPNLRLIQADALDWLANSTESFDCIIDDLFLHGKEDPERPVELDRHWFDHLKAHLEKNGLLIQNHIDMTSARKAASFMKGGSTLGFQTEKYENLVLAWFRGVEDTNDLRGRLSDRLDALPRSETRRLRSRVFKFRS
ncbi:MAG: methyltransferase domain-containing protein [Pseudomonadales bacterium]|nr:methyltransferase domain-containing protein [Pseudomonadales bacterium]MBO6594795.1 methyltransferase domain-containing protein [Pseudomonadales bacterium]MBO6821645.1 methyltransferase domain-containing protein [Pseudomonadales bacterium]